MTIQKRFIAVFVSSDDKIYYRAVVYDSHNLNAAFFSQNRKIDSEGAASRRAGELMTQIKNFKKENYDAIMYQYDTWEEIPKSVVINNTPITGSNNLMGA
jgi:transcription antitermination factor NusA-like protein